MRAAAIFFNDVEAGILEEQIRGQQYVFRYLQDYSGPPVSLTLPVQQKEFQFKNFPPFLDGLLPEGSMLESLLRQKKIDRSDYLSQLFAVGEDLVGAVTVKVIR